MNPSRTREQFAVLYTDTRGYTFLHANGHSGLHPGILNLPQALAYIVNVGIDAGPQWRVTSHSGHEAILQRTVNAVFGEIRKENGTWVLTDKIDRGKVDLGKRLSHALVSVAQLGWQVDEALSPDDQEVTYVGLWKYNPPAKKV